MVKLESFEAGHATLAGRAARHGARAMTHPPVARRPRRGRGFYSRLVAFAKYLLPAVAVALLLLVVAWPQIDPDDRNFRISMTDIDLEAAQRLQMVNARLDGVDEDGQPYSVLAEMALQAEGKDGTIYLEAPQADLLTEEGTWVALTAETGAYYQNEERLELIGDVRVFHDQGFEIATEFAEIQLDRGFASGMTGVVGQGPTADLTAQGFELHDRGRRIVFTGESRLILYGDPVAGTEPVAPAAAAPKGGAAEPPPREPVHER